MIVQFEIDKPLIKVCGVPPEEMRLDRYARNFKESRIVGHERIVPMDQMIGMGWDREKCLEHVQGQGINEFTMEAQLRNPGRFMSTRVGDGVLYGEWYVKADKDGDGIPELRYICTMGEDHEIVSDEEANRVKFALFSCDPISHTIVGDSICDYTQDVQKIKTNMMRGILDSLAESINPKTVVNELMVNLDDALNDDLGAVIRTRGDPSQAVMYTQTPFVGQAAMPVLELLNDQLARRTGLTDAAKGLDPKAIQSSTQIGVEAVINGAQERVELVARVLCETGFKDLFTGLYNEICENPNPPRTLKVNGKFVPYDTSTFDQSMSVEVNPNLGKGNDMVRMMALSGIKNDQQAIVNQMGLSNPIVGIPEMLNTMTDMLALANVKNVARYFKTPNPQQMQQLLSAPKTPDPQAMAAQAMMEKVRAESAKAVGAATSRPDQDGVGEHLQAQAAGGEDADRSAEARHAGASGRRRPSRRAGAAGESADEEPAGQRGARPEVADGHGRVADEAGPDCAARRAGRAGGAVAGGFGVGVASAKHGEDPERPRAGHDQPGGGAPCGDDRSCDWRRQGDFRRAASGGGSPARAGAGAARPSASGGDDRRDLGQSGEDRQDEAEGAG